MKLAICLAFSLPLCFAPWAQATDPVASKTGIAPSTLGKTSTAPTLPGQKTGNVAGGCITFNPAQKTGNAAGICITFKPGQKAGNAAGSCIPMSKKLSPVQTKVGSTRPGAGIGQKTGAETADCEPMTMPRASRLRNRQ